MRRTWVSVVGILAAGCVAAGATTVDHRWSGDAYVIHVRDIASASANGYLLSTFYIVNEGKWEIVRDTVNDAIVFPTGAHSPLEDADVRATLKAYEELELTLPAALIAEGDEVSIYVMWVDDEEPAATFTVEKGGPAPSESASGSSSGAQLFFAPIRMALPLEVKAEYDAAGGAKVTIANPGTVVYRGTLKVTASLSYFRDWVGESVTRFLDSTVGRILLAPDAALKLTVKSGASAEERYAVTFLDLTDRSGGVPLAVSVPSPTERAVAAFRDMIYNIWTSVSDKEPGTDYIDLGFGAPGVHLYFPIAPYFDPPR
ncbi:MAG: hypothetical protein PHU43_00010 [Candidatus Bipolaricaulis sp.]|nr:hypothetical protein [Candidatus Bipolaricaulis sp.]